MSRFIQNLNTFVDRYSIKQAFIAERAGIEKNKLSRIFKGSQPVTAGDMDIISNALGKDVSFFLSENFQLNTPDYKETTSIAFYMGDPDESKKVLANDIFNLLEHIDSILSINKKLNIDALEVSDYGF